ncbi:MULTISPECIES: spherulation-specific family 4 protein [Streptomyces]|uniref:spherulation-specific family 4 protein n=1 Tax=Streptomyces herbicida TaxID=3065675 RepID=UPI00292E55BA|nr:spherulation-specific family 4 protein [Streptomyces sp. NEAU-HV9]
MPHLTSTKPGTAGTVVRTGFGIPGFAHPLVAPMEWGELTRPGTPLHWVVLNVSGGGPGTRPDPHCLEAAGRLRNAGVRVLGHLDTIYGARAYADLLSDAHRYLDWYRVDGFLLDRCPGERAALPEVRRTINGLRAIRADTHVVLGHGTHPHPGYAENADQLVTFSGSWADYRWSQVAEWTGDHPPDRFCHFVHGVPRGHLDEALRIARWQGAATIYFTDRTDRGGRADPWETMPGYWDEIVSRIGTGVSE